MNYDYKIIIPARWSSSRFPGKVIAHINGKPMVQHTYERAIKTNASEVIIATDRETIYEIAKKFGAHVEMTGPATNGTSRIAEVAKKRLWIKDQVIVNLQADEPTIHYKNIHKVAIDLHRNVSCDVATLQTSIKTEAELNDPNIVKVVTNADRHALYFSRLPLRSGTGDIVGHKHIGIYAYRGASLNWISGLKNCALEKIEQLEQLRVLYQGGKIHVSSIKYPMGPAVDVPSDIDKVEKYLKEHK